MNTRARENHFVPHAAIPPNTLIPAVLAMHGEEGHLRDEGGVIAGCLSTQNQPVN